MGSHILVTFATRRGTTRDVAQAVADTLREAGLEVELKPAREVKDLDAYRGIVIGAPLQMYRWHKDALSLLQKHEQTLIRRPVAVFAVGPVTPEEKEWEEARGQLAKELARFPRFLPFETRVFGGKFDPNDLKFPWTLLPGMKKWPASDVRDPEAVRSWAGQVAARFAAGES